MARFVIKGTLEGYGEVYLSMIEDFREGKRIKVDTRPTYYDLFIRAVCEIDEVIEINNKNKSKNEQMLNTETALGIPLLIYPQSLIPCFSNIHIEEE